MSTLDKAYEMCVEIGKILAQTDEYKKVKESEYKLFHDKEARELMENLQVAQMENQKKLLAGLELTEEDNKKVQEAEKIALGHPTIKFSYYANNKFNDMMKAISAKIREGIKSTEGKRPE